MSQDEIKHYETCCYTLQVITSYYFLFSFTFPKSSQTNRFLQIGFASVFFFISLSRIQKYIGRTTGCTLARTCTFYFVKHSREILVLVIIYILAAINARFLTSCRSFLFPEVYKTKQKNHERKKKRKCHQVLRNQKS